MKATLEWVGVPWHWVGLLAPIWLTEGVPAPMGLTGGVPAPMGLTGGVPAIAAQEAAAAAAVLWGTARFPGATKPRRVCSHQPAGRGVSQDVIAPPRSPPCPSSHGGSPAAHGSVPAGAVLAQEQEEDEQSQPEQRAGGSDDNGLPQHPSQPSAPCCHPCNVPTVSPLCCHLHPHLHPIVIPICTHRGPRLLPMALQVALLGTPSPAPLKAATRTQSWAPGLGMRVSRR